MKEGDIVCWHYSHNEHNKCWYIVRNWSDAFIFGGIVDSKIFAGWRIKKLKQ